MAITMSPEEELPRNRMYGVKQGRRTIGYIQFWEPHPSWGIPAGWRFISNRKDVYDRMPGKAHTHTTPMAALAHVKARLG